LNNLAKKAIFHGTSLAVIFFISSKLVLACQSIVCNNGIKSDICSIGTNIIVAKRYFYFSLVIFIAVSILYFIRGRKGIETVIFCFISVFSPILLRFLSGSGGCDFFATQVAKWLFYFSMISFTFQIISWINQRKTSRKLK
jgi:hypothetical protein